jgi:hypothetical protein
MTPSPNPPHGRHHHDHSSRSMPPVNAMRNGNNSGPPINMPLSQSGPAPLPPLHPTDFPPLTSTAIPERRSPTMGAWSNLNIRSGLPPNQVQQHHPSARPYPNFANNIPIHHFDESDRSFERPPPKVSLKSYHRLLIIRYSRSLLNYTTISQANDYQPTIQAESSGPRTVRMISYSRTMLLLSR